MEPLIPKGARQARAAHGQVREKEEVNLPRGSSERRELATERNTTFSLQEIKGGILYQEAQFKSSFPGIKPPCPILALGKIKRETV